MSIISNLVTLLSLGLSIERLTLLVTQRSNMWDIRILFSAFMAVLP